MRNESDDLSKTLAWTYGMISQSGHEDRLRIALAYREAQELVVGIPLDLGDARPRIMACLRRSDSYRMAEDIACVGWTLMAIQERANECNLPNWQELLKIVNTIVKMLPPSKPVVH